MTTPVPGHTITTPYGKRGKHWSCGRDNAGNGVHTGADYAAPRGTPVVAARAGTVRHTAYGTAFGPYQFAVVCPDGTEDFYAHTLDRPGNGTKVAAGQRIARVGDLGNVTGPHLHFERHKRAGSWSCTNHTDPAPSINAGDTVSIEYQYLGKPAGTLNVGRKYTRLDASSWDPKNTGLEHTLVYLNVRPTFAPGKTAGGLRVRLIRANGDASAYHDYLISADVLEDGTQLVTHTYFELGDGKATRIELRCQGGLQSAVIGTRYTKKCVVK